MSGYGKGQEPYVYDAAATRPNQHPNYASFAQPSFASQYPDAQARLPHEPSTADMPFIPSSTYESRASTGYQAQYPFIDARSRHLPGAPEITSFEPTEGRYGDKLLIHLRAKYDLTSQQSSVFHITFGNKKCSTVLSKIDQTGEDFHFTLTTDVPALTMTDYINGQLPLGLHMEDLFGQTMDVFEVGQFTYADLARFPTYSTSPDLSRKRKYSTEVGEAPDYMKAPSAKRSFSERIYARPRTGSNTFSTVSTVSPNLSYSQPSMPGNFAYPSGYERSKQQSSYNPSSMKSLYAVPSGMGLSQTNIKAQSPNLSSYSPYTSSAHTGRSPATPARTPVMPSPAALTTPPLVRTSTIPPSAEAAASSRQTFNPYLMYPNSKAILKLDGELDKMSEGWSREEIDAKRRLVQFHRNQAGSTVTASFKRVSPESRAPHSICVSCILWEEKGECFITSVDTIMLLESLINARFTVEEKNRIRRNLEGFRPLTVSKAKPDSEEFFKVIMGFPSPKPRNIEKDVKVFPWKILPHALKKIVGKFSADYSSTAGALPAPIPTSYSGGLHSESTTDVHRNTSPRSVASSAASTAYNPNLTSTGLSPNIKVSAGLEGSAGQGVSVPQLDPTGHGMSPWGASAHHQVSQYSTGLPSAGRGSWEFGAFLEANPSSAVSSAGQSLQLQRSDVTRDSSQVPGHGSYQPYGQRTSRG